jgi:CHAD domain-containing protein
MTAVDASYQLLACQYIRGQIKALNRRLRGARFARDIEHVHQARVASRRLRAALRMFSDCFPPAKVGRWRKQLRQLTRRLGAARDADVQIMFLKKFISEASATSKKLRPGLRRVLLRLKQRRQSIQPKVVKVLDRLREYEVLADIRAEAGRIERRLVRLNTDIHSPFVFEQAKQHIEGRLEGLLSYQHCLDDPDAKKDHHQMRIAAKRLRYVLEICNLPFDNRLDEYIEAMKNLQSLLGKLQDCYVWLDDLESFIQKEKRRTIKYFGSERTFARLKPGLDYLVEHRRKDRELLFEQSVAFWQELQKAGFSEKLRSILQDHNSQSSQAPLEKVRTASQNIGQ